ncbi:MAG: winged helix-turn-helix domain-containing protein [Nitrososphaerota archaeon]|jgi:DNA-binding transcriptional ArsR family regulator|nr:winged helix-turn-helix domain-containing protein [Nitrososphaerota archaeon]
MEIEEVFSSKSRMKILRVLHKLGQLTVSDIGRYININYSATDKHLRLLESEGILKQYLFGQRIRMYSFNETSEKAKSIQTLIQVWEQQNKH